MDKLHPMSDKEIKRLEIMTQLSKRQITQASAAEHLGISVRQLKRIWRLYKEFGAVGLIHKSRGKPSHNQLKETVAGVVFAQATYEFDENCNPVLANEVRLNYVPDSVLYPDQKPFETKTVPNVPPPPPHNGGASIDAVDTCHLRTWEEDAPGLDMIAVQVDQTYSWNGSTVTLSNGSTSATTYFSWWHLDSGPTGTAGYHSSQVAWSNGEASFYCDGAPFCSGGRAYDITLYDYMTVDYQGGCDGYGTYSGTVVPLGRVLYNVWQ